MENDLTTIGLIIACAAVIAWFVLWSRRPEPVPLDHDEPTELDELLRPAEDRDWTREALAVVREPGDPLTRTISDIELGDALLFEEIAAAYPVRLDWAPPGFTQEWQTLGTVLAEMGDTQTFTAVAA